MSDGDSGSGCGGCFTTIAALILLWAFVFGVTYNGKHYGLSCSCDKGVEISP